jgi:hypothetical protein
MNLLTYKLHQLSDAAARQSLFHDMLTSERGITAEELPCFLDAVDALLSEAWIFQQDAEARLADAQDNLRRLADLIDDLVITDADDFYTQATNLVAALEKDLHHAPD